MSVNSRGKPAVKSLDQYSGERNKDISERYCTLPFNKEPRSASSGAGDAVRHLNRALSDVGQRQNSKSGRYIGSSAGRKRYLVPLPGVASNTDINEQPPVPRSLSANVKNAATRDKSFLRTKKPPRIAFSDWSGDNEGDSVRTNVELSPETILSNSGSASFLDVKEIDLRARHLTVVPPLDKFVAVRILDLSGNDIKHINGLQRNKELRALKLYDNKIVELSDLNRLGDLQSLHLQHNCIKCIGKSFQGLTKLKDLRLDFNHISQLMPSELTVCSQLTSLDLSSNQLGSIAAVNCLHNLEELFVRNNRIVTVSDLSNCKKLQEIDLSNNPLTDLSGLRSVTSMTSINVSQCPVQTLDNLHQLRNMEELYAANCRLVDLKQVVAFFPQLEILDISHNCISSVEEMEILQFLTGLLEFSIIGNPLCSSSDQTVSVESLVHRLLPQLKVLNSRKVESSGSQCSEPTAAVVVITNQPPTEIPELLPLTDAEKVASDEMVQQLSSLETQLSSFKTDITARFSDLRASFNVLPSEPPPPSARSSSESTSSRPASRSGIKSRLQDAKLFASQNFNT